MKTLFGPTPGSPLPRMRGRLRASLWRLAALIAAGVWVGALCSAVSASTGQPSQPVGVRMLFDPPIVPVPVVSATVDGRGPFLLVLDTGAEPGIILEPWAAAMLGDILGKSVPYGLHTDGGSPVAGAKVYRRPMSIRLSGGGAWCILRCPDLVVAQTAPLRTWGARRRLAGYIGAGALKLRVVTLDYARRTLTVYPARARAPMSSSDSHATCAIGGGRLFLPVDIAGQRTLVLIDTGNERTILPRGAQRSFAVTGHSVAICCRIEGGVHTLDRLRISGRLGPIRLRAFGAEFADRSVFTPCIGSDLLSRSQVTLDMYRHVAIFAVAPNSQRLPKSDGYAGAAVRANRDRYVVSMLVPGSPAAIAGLDENDTVLSVNGRAVQGLGQGMVNALLSGDCGSEAVLRVQRGERTLTVRFVRASCFSAGRSGLGLQMGFSPGQPLYVTTVEPDAPASLAGVRSGDEVISLDGIEGRFTADEIALSLTAPNLSIIVDRRGWRRRYRLAMSETVSRLVVRKGLPRLSGNRR